MAKHKFIVDIDKNIIMDNKCGKSTNTIDKSNRQSPQNFINRKCEKIDRRPAKQEMDEILWDYFVSIQKENGEKLKKLDA